MRCGGIACYSMAWMEGLFGIPGGRSGCSGSGRGPGGVRAGRASSGSDRERESRAVTRQLNPRAAPISGRAVEPFSLVNAQSPTPPASRIVSARGVIKTTDPVP